MPFDPQVDASVGRVFGRVFGLIKKLSVFVMGKKPEALISCIIIELH
jgi:hypothetical protein